jgi:shikimate 5-dehydrogenase
VCPDNALPAAAGQITLSNMLKWRCDQLSSDCGLCGVIGDPVLHSLGPGYHNMRFASVSKNLLYLPLECQNPLEAKHTIESLKMAGVSLTSPLKELLPIHFGLTGPLNTLWRQRFDSHWQGANTDLIALTMVLRELPPGPVLVLGDGGVAKTTQQAILQCGWPCLLFSRRLPLPLSIIRNFNPVGVLQATRLGMNHNDPIPFPDVIASIKHSLQWGIEWIYKENTAFASWIKDNGYHLVSGKTLFEIQAHQQSIIFIHQCSR